MCGFREKLGGEMAQMKQVPVTYEVVYDSESSGFKPCKTNLGWVMTRKVVAQPRLWNSGFAISFQIVDKIQPHDRAVLGLDGTETHHIMPVFEKIQVEAWFYDFVEPKIPAKDWHLVSGLAHGDIRGCAAEEIVGRLYNELFMPTQEMLTWLPNVVASFNKIREMYPES